MRTPGWTICVATVWLLAGSWELSGRAAEIPAFVKATTIAAATEWRFRPLLTDLDGDSHLDLVATARLARNALHVWRGDGRGTLTEITPTWSSTGYAALATGDINRDGFPDIVSASHFGPVQTLLSDGKGAFNEQLLPRDDGFVAAQLGDVDSDGRLDLVLVGYQKLGIQIYRGDGTGNWSATRTLPEAMPPDGMPGRDLVVADLNHDGHLDLVAAFQRWGIYVYYGDGTGAFIGGPVAFRQPWHTPESLAVGDVHHDGHPNGPDVYLGDGHGAWKASSAGLKVFSRAAAGVALGDVDGDGKMDIVAAGSFSGNAADRFGLCWFRGDGSGGWQLVRESGLPIAGLSWPHSITLADLDRDGAPEIVALNGGQNGDITIWQRESARSLNVQAISKDISVR
jgi:hypothetical protein